MHVFWAGQNNLYFFSAAQDSRLKVVYALGEVPEDWDGEEGFIDTEMIEKHVTKPNEKKQKVINIYLMV